MVGVRRAPSMGAGSELKLKSQTHHHCKTNKSLECVDPPEDIHDIHNPSPRATLAQITFRHPFRNKHIKKLAKVSRNHGIVITRNLDYDISRIKLPSCLEKIVPSDCGAIIDQIAKEPMLTAEDTYHKYRLNPLICNNCSFKVRNANYPFIGPVSIVHRDTPPGRKMGLIGTRRTGWLRGQAAAAASKADKA